MHLTRHSCRRILSKDDHGGRGLLIGVLLLLVLGSSAWAWNKAGHMVSGAIAYADLQQTRPQTLEQVVALLKTHPHFETKWKPQLTQSFVAPDEQNLLLFMLAARWPDDIRGDTAFHHGAWHYQRSAKKLMQHRADGGHDRRQIHPRVGGDDHGIPLA